VPGLVKGAWIPIGSDKTGWVHDPAIHQFLEPPLLDRVEDGGAPQGVQVPIGIEPHLRRAVVAVRQFLAGIAQRLEMANGFGVLEGCHGRKNPMPILTLGAPHGDRYPTCQMARHRLIRVWQPDGH